MQAFLNYYKEYIRCDDPNDYMNIDKLIDTWDIDAFYILFTEYSHRTSQSTFIAVSNNITNNSDDSLSKSMERSEWCSSYHMDYLIRRFTWEIYDKVFDSVLSLSDTLMNDSMMESSMNNTSTSYLECYLMVLYAIAENSKPKELYIMSIEKLVTLSNSNDSMSLSILMLYSLQRALVPLRYEGSYLSSGLSIAIQVMSTRMKQISTQTKGTTIKRGRDDGRVYRTNLDASHSDETSRNATILLEKLVEMALSFYDGVYYKSKLWDNITNISSNSNQTPSASNVHAQLTSGDNGIPSDEDNKQGIIFVAYLLQLSSQCIATCPHSHMRAKLMKKVSHRILSNFLSLDDILVHPFRLRYRILRAKMKQIQDRNHILGHSNSVKRLRKTVYDQSNEVIDTGLLDSVPIHHREQLVALAMDYMVPSKRTPIANQNMPVVDAGGEDSRHSPDRRSLRNWSQLIPWAEVSHESLQSLITTNDGNDYNRHYMESNEINRDDGIVNTENRSIESYSAEDLYFHPKLPWDMTGLSMVAQTILCANKPSNGIVGEVEDNQSNVDRNDLMVSIYSPQHIYDMFSVFLTPLLQNPVLGSNEGLQMTLALEKVGQRMCQQQSSVAVSSVSLISQAQPICNHNSQLATVPFQYSYFPYVVTDNSVSKSSDMTLSALLDSSSTPTLDISRSIEADYSIGYVSSQSHDSLKLVQSIMNSIASCSDSTLRSDAYMAFRSMLMLFEERSRLVILQKLVQDCPFESLTGLLIDIVKDNCQSVSRGQHWGYYPIHSHLLPNHSNSDVSVEMVRKDTNNSNSTRAIDENPENLSMRAMEMTTYSPFWSPIVVSMFVNKILGSLSSYSSEEIMNRIDEINATIALLQFILLRIQSSLKTDDRSVLSQFFGQTNVAMTSELKMKLSDILYPIKDQVNKAFVWVKSVLSDSKSNQSVDFLRLQLLESNLHHLVEITADTISCLQSLEA